MGKFSEQNWGDSAERNHQRDGQFSGVDYGYHIGFVWFLVNWSKDSDRTSWWEYPVIDMPLLSCTVTGG